MNRLDELQEVLNLEEIKDFNDFKKYYKNQKDYSELENKIFEIFCRRCLENIDFDFEFHSDGNYIMSKEVNRSDDDYCPLIMIKFDVSIDKGFEIFEYMDIFNYFWRKLTKIYKVKDLESDDCKIINFFKKYIEEKFFPTEKEIKKYILKYRK